jgi:hypothetical protein
MVLIRFISVGNYLLENEGGYWLVIPKEWDELMIQREEYLGIKWELIYKKMTFEKLLSCVKISKMKLFSANVMGY